MIPIGDTRRRFGFPWMTVFLLALCVVIFLYERRTSLAYSALSILPRDLESSPNLSLLFKAMASMLVQGPGWLEPITNLLFLWVLGNKVEDACGPWGLLSICLLSAVGGVAAKMIIHPLGTEPVFGLAGVIAGLFGAYLVVYGFRPIPTWVPPMVARLTPVPVVLHMLYWAGLVFVNIDFGLLRSGKVLQSVSFEPTWPFVSALAIGLICGRLFTRREYLWLQILQKRAAAPIRH